MREFVFAATAVLPADTSLVPEEVQLKRDCGFTASVYYLLERAKRDGKVVFAIAYDESIMRKPGANDKHFTQNFRKRCKTAKGFSGVTLSLLHEMGHLENPLTTMTYERHGALMKIRDMRLRDMITEDEAHELYFKLPDENAATEWAIEWLSDPEHRKIAKDFEKKYFACFEKTC